MTAFFEINGDYAKLLRHSYPNVPQRVGVLQLKQQEYIKLNTELKKYPRDPVLVLPYRDKVLPLYEKAWFLAEEIVLLARLAEIEPEKIAAAEAARDTLKKGYIDTQATLYAYEAVSKV